MKKIHRLLLTLLSVFSLTAFLLFPFQVFAHSEEAAFTATLNTKNPLKPVLVLKNDSETPCQVLTTAIGTVSVDKMSQSGKDIVPQQVQVGLDESPEIYYQGKLKTLNHDESIELPLRVFKYNNGHALQAVTWSQAAGAYGLLYEFVSDKPYTLTVTYAAPITSPNATPMCTTASTSNGTGQNTMLPDLGSGSNVNMKMIAGVVIVLLLIILLVLFLLKRRNSENKKSSGKKGVTAAVLFLVFALSPLCNFGTVYADYSVPSSAQGAFDDCMATLNEHRDITGPILDFLAGRHVEIVPTDDRTNDSTALPDGSFRIYWDPESLYNYYSDGAPIPSTPCDRLFHEMYHAYDIGSGTFSRDDCAGSGIETKEVMATRAQNALREALGLPPRTHYGDRPLPAGSCTAPPPAPTCTGRCGSSNGDPHLYTFDKLRYDFMAVGEFVLARDTKTNDFEVQTRQEPWPNARDVSVNTATAMRVGTSKVEIGLDGYKLQLWIDGKKAPSRNTKLPEGSVSFNGETQATISWTDGSNVYIQPIGTSGLYVIVNPSEARKGQMEGLLGTMNDDSSDELQIRGGGKIKEEFDQIYPKYADSWRIDDKTSLFTYANGKNTASYTDKSFPDKPITVANIPNRSAAEALCKDMGVTNKELLEDCIIDVGRTGRPEFAKILKVEQHASSVVDLGGKSWKVDIGKPGDTKEVTFDGKENEKIFIAVTNSTLPDQCGNLKLTAPTKGTIETGCIMNGKGMIDGTVLPETGTYTISLSSTETGTGVAYLRLLTVQDQKGTIVPDGAAISAVQDKPGVVTEFTFTGNAGQRMYVDFQNSTLPDQCGGIGVTDSEGGSIGTGCIIHGVGNIDTFELPAAGTYTLRIDPIDQNTGKTSVKIVVAEDVKKELTVGGSSSSIQLKKPGSRALFTFNGVAGQRIFVDMTSSLDSQCGGIDIKDASDKTVDTGCIINGKGTFDEKGIVLPSTGVFTITIDPRDDITGEVKVSVRR